MVRGLRTALATAGISLFAAMPASAALVGISGPDSTNGVEAKIVATPTTAFDPGFVTDGIVVFEEALGVTVPAGLVLDDGTTADSFQVDSHLVYMRGTGGNFLAHGTEADPVKIEFDGPILGIMGRSFDSLDTVTSLLTGSVTYLPAYFEAGLEGKDFAKIDGNVLSLGLITYLPGDWLRVLTLSVPPSPPPAAEVPVPASMLLLGTGLLGLGMARRRKPAA